MTVAAPLPADRRARLVDFAARMRRRQVRLAAGNGAMRAALALALPALAVVWFWPRHGLLVGALVAALAAASAALAAVRARRISAAQLLRIDGDAEGLSQLGDGLATWLENDRRTAVRQRPMADWLADDLDRDIRALPTGAIRRVGRRRLGRLRWILVLLILLLLAWLVSLWWQPPWPGALGGRPDQPRDGSSPQSTAGAAAGGGDVDVAPVPQPNPIENEARPDPPRREPPPQPEPADEPPPAEPPPSEPPAPLLQLPPQQLFTVPEFIADGPTRRMRAHVAEVSGGEAPQAQRPAGNRGGGDAPPPPPPPDAAAFDRAAERAQAARHVPETERAIVRRFFELLREAAK